MSAVLELPAPVARPMRESDLQRVLVVERDAYDFPWSEGVFLDCLRVGYCCWVIEHQGIVEGHGILQVGAAEAHLLNLCIRPMVARQGFGMALLERLLDVACSHGAEAVFLEVRPSNVAAIALYRRCDFTEVGLRRGYYPVSSGAPAHDEGAVSGSIEESTRAPIGKGGGREDALIFSRRLPARWS